MKNLKPILVATVALFCQCIGYSQEYQFVKLDSFFNTNIENGKLAGVVTLLSHNNKVQHLKTYGYLDVKNKIPINKDVIIPIASMTKIVTSIAVLQLYEKGHFLLDDPIEKYIPEFKNTRVFVSPDTNLTEDLITKPTIRDLLRHTSGMVYSYGNTVTDRLYLEAGFRTWNGTLHDFVKEIAQMPMAFQPNTEYAYSYSHDVLGYLVEIVSGKRLDKYCTKNIFNPLKLKNTDFYVPKEKSYKQSNLYQYLADSLALKDSRDSSVYNGLPAAISGGGGWWDSYGGIVTSIEEFHAIAQALLNYGEYDGARILNKSTVKLMITNQIGEFDAYGEKYGLGVGVVTSKEDSTITEEIFWAGSPYNTYFWIDYEDKNIGIMFTNTAPFGHLNLMESFKKMVEFQIEN